MGFNVAEKKEEGLTEKQEATREFTKVIDAMISEQKTRPDMVQRLERLKALHKQSR